ncbi:MAG: PQQ-binding-like beta-propeller repeat protein [Verrucomicrobiota bacterium]
MTKIPAFTAPAGLALLCATTAFAAADWNQWRGPQRNGVLPQSPPLMNSFPADGLKELWESEMIPSNDDGGLGSIVVANGRAYLSVVWHSDVPSETRTIDDLVMRKLGYQNPNGLGKEVVAKMEAERLALSPTLRGAKLDEHIQKWIEANLDKKQKQLFNGFVSGRFKKGKFAIPLDDFEKLQAQVDKPFASDGELKQWLEAQGFSDFVKEQVLQTVPPTKRVAEDVVVCLDLATGKTLWKAKSPGEPKGRTCSSTPAVVAGKVYAMGSTHAYCVDAQSGKQIWSAPLPTKGPGSSPLVVDGVVVVNAGRLVGYDAASGKQLWRQEKAGGANSSPVSWSSGGRNFTLSNGRNDIACLDPKTGVILWTAPAGGDCTPAIVDDVLAVQSRNPKLGALAYKLSPQGAERLWSFPIDALRTQSSPIIYGGHVYLMDDNVHYCFELATGKLTWQATVPSTISSPLLADGKIYALINNGNNVQMIKATGAERIELGKANVRAAWVPSPTIADGKLILRMKDRVRCFNLAEAPKASASAKLPFP